VGLLNFAASLVFAICDCADSDSRTELSGRIHRDR
jgi:hypothetical protein